MKKETLLRLYKYLFAYRRGIVTILGIMAVTTIISLSASLLMEYAISVCMVGRSVPGLLKLGVGVMVLFVIFLIGTRARIYTMAGVSNRVPVTIREELYEHTQALGFHFFDSRPARKILARVIGGVNLLEGVLLDSVTQLIPDMPTVFCVAVIMVMENYKLTMTVLLILPLLLLNMLSIGVQTHRRWWVYRKKTSNLDVYAHEDLSGIKVVQSFAVEPEIRQGFVQLTKEHQQAFLDTVRLADGFGSVVEITWGLNRFLLYYIGIEIVGVEGIDIGMFLTFFTYIAMFWNPIRNLTNFYNKLVTNISGVERVFNIMDTKADIVDRDRTSELPDIQGEVAFKHVSFAYQNEPEQMALEDVNFRIWPGETIALVGLVGAGKTTVMNLISRFYDVTAGRITIDGYDVQDVTVRNLRRQMGIMTQGNFLLSGAVRRNIRHGQLNAMDEGTATAAGVVDTHRFIISLGHGCNTQIGERGARLSTGQRQLLAFTRTMVSDPRILVLDEATSSIDTYTGLLVQRGIATVLERGTSFMIAHRPSTIHRTGHILVINNGNVMEAGTYEMLMGQGGIYYQLYQSQFSH